MEPDVRESYSRRSFMAAAIGGLAASVAALLGNPQPAEAAAGSPLILGSQGNNAGTADTQLITSSSVVGLKVLQNSSATGLMGYTTSKTGNGRGVYGRSDSRDGFGVVGANGGPPGTGAAINAMGGENRGLVATSMHLDGILGWSPDGRGVVGSSINGSGVVGYSDKGYAGDFHGPLRLYRYLDVTEMTPPANPPANTARLFVRDNGAGKTLLCVLFPTGTVQVVAQQA